MNASTLDLRYSKAGIFVRCMLESAALLARPRALAFFLPQIAAGALLLAALMSFHRSPLDAVLGPVVRGLGGEEALHYPRFFFHLPRIFDALAFVVNAFAASIGWIAFLVAAPRLFLGDEIDERRCWNTARAAIGRTWAVTVPVAALAVVVSVVIVALDRGFLGQSPRLISLAEIAGFTIVTLAQVLSVYALPAIALRDASAGAAWSRSFDLATRNLGITAGFVLAPRLLEVPFRALTSELPQWWRSIDPESVVFLECGILLVSSVGMLITLGAVVRFHLHRFGESESLP